jgi:fatty-acyl-CoA synthase
VLFVDHQLHVGRDTTARERPRAWSITHRNLWTNATTFGWQAGVTTATSTCTRCRCSTATAGAMPYAMAGMGVKQVVLRKVDGAEILRRVEQHGVTVMCGAPAVVNAVLDAAPLGGPIPGAGCASCRRRPAAHPTIERVETELGWEFIQIYGLTETAPLLTMNRTRAEWDDLDPAGTRRALAGPGPRRSGCRMRISGRRGAGPLQPRDEGYWEQPEATAARDGRRLVPHRRRRRHRRRGLPDIWTARRTSSSPAARTCRRSRSRTRCSATPTSPRWR